MHNPSFINERRSSLVGQIRMRLFSGVGLLAIILFIHLFVGTFTSTAQNQENEQSSKIRDMIDTLQTAMIDQETGLRGYIATGDQAFLEPFYRGHSSYVETVPSLKSLLNSSSFNSTYDRLLAVERQADIWYQQYALIQLTNMQQGHIKLARSEETSKQGKALFDNLRTFVDRLQQASKRDIDQRQQLTGNANTTITIASFLLSLAIILFLWRIFARITGTMQYQLSLLKETTRHLGQGNFAVRVPSLPSEELDSMGHTFNDMAEALQRQNAALKDRDILESVLRLNTILTSTLDFDTLSRTFLDRALTLLNMQLAALYLYNRKTQRLSLTGAQGFDLALLTPEFALGEGLVGRVALSCESLYLTQLEPGEFENFKAKTLFGHALPNSIYELPLIQGNELLGVIVLGSLYPISEQARNILNVVVSNLSAVISHTKAYQQIQIQTEQLMASSRELEQTNIALRIQRDELRVLNNALEEANRARSQFLSTMTHELRTPLTTILGFSQILQRDLKPDEQRNRTSIERIIKSGHHLLDLVNDALDLARIEAGTMQVNLGQVDLPLLLDEVVNDLRPIAQEKKLDLQVQIAKNVESIESDASKLRQILLNLVSNALKFTEQGEVRLSAKFLAGEQLALGITDTGIGITQEQQERIFEAFYQGESSITRKYGGTGLGLSIARQLTLLLGGTLTLESQPGHGSTFTLFLPRVLTQGPLEDSYQDDGVQDKPYTSVSSSLSEI